MCLVFSLNSSGIRFDVFDFIQLPSITFPKVPFFSNLFSIISYFSLRQFLLFKSIVSISWFIKQFISIESNSPSINGEWSLSTFGFSSLMHIRFSLSWANIGFDFFRKEIILVSWLIWSWTLKLSMEQSLLVDSFNE